MSTSSRPGSCASSSASSSAVSAAIAALALCGCSLTMHAPPSPPKVELDPGCTESAIPPAVDTGVAVIAGLIFLPTLAYSVRPHCGLTPGDSTCNDVIRRTALISGLTTTVFGLSAYRGFGVEQTCRHAYTEHDAWIASHPPPTAPTAPAPPTKPDHHDNHGYQALLLGGLVVVIIIVAASAESVSQGFHL